MRNKGKITKWNGEKGFGFITPLSGKEQVFFHISSLKNHQSRPAINQNVTYTVSKDKQGRQCAINVSKENDISNTTIIRQVGKITHWDDDKGYGFITPINGGKKIFIHIKAFQNHYHRPSINQVVAYNISQDAAGRYFAENVSRQDNGLNTKSNGKINYITLMISIVAVIIFYFYQVNLVFNEKLHYYILIFYVIISFITSFLYWQDKSASENAGWRKSENLLHFVSLIGGWSGALIAQQVLRHKTNKQSFKSIFFLTMCINMILFILIFNSKVF